MTRPAVVQGRLLFGPPEGERIRDAIGRLGARIRLLERRLEEDYQPGIYQRSGPRWWVPIGEEEAAAGRLTAQATALLMELRELGRGCHGADLAWETTCTRLDALTPRDAWRSW